MTNEPQMIHSSVPRGQNVAVRFRDRNDIRRKVPLKIHYMKGTYLMSNESVLKKLKAEKADNAEEIRQLNNRIKIITNRERDAERRERTHRLIEKGAIIESLLPHTADMSGEEFKAFLLHLLDEEVPL